MNKIITLLAVILLLISCNNKTKPGQDEQLSEEFTIAFMTDIHLQPELHAVEGFKKAIDTVNKLNPDFVITGGDLVMDALNATYGRADSLYNLYINVSKEFKIPVHNTIGNHELFGVYRRNDIDTSHSEYGRRMFEKRIGKRYYSFDHKGWHFMVLDGIVITPERAYIGLIDDNEIEWIKSDLKKVDKKTPIALSVHIPFITSQTQLTEGSLAANPEYRVIKNARDVLLLFWEYNLKLVLQGHLHFLEDIYVNDDVHFITGGAVCGRWWKNKPESYPEEGFMLVHFNGEKITSEYVDYGWVPSRAGVE